MSLFDESLECRKDECCHFGCLGTSSVCVVALSVSVFLEGHIMLLIEKNKKASKK